MYERSNFLISCWIFLRVLGFVFLIAFFSFWVQIDGLIGSEGILPASSFLYEANFFHGFKAYLIYPTLAWISSSDLSLNLIAITGIISSFLLLIGILPRISLIFLFIIYLSLVTVGQNFMSFQWDILLLETGFLSIFIAPSSLISIPSKDNPPSKLIVVLFWILLFKLMFSSGMGKLGTGDETWRSFTALNYHYYTQPLPTPLAWYLYQLPVWFHKVSVGIMFIIEIFIPFLFFAPRRLRHLGAVMTIFLQLTILISGNYAFFNLLSIAICLMLFDDEFLKRVIPDKLKEYLSLQDHKEEQLSITLYKKIGLTVLASLFLFFSLLNIGGRVIGFRNLPSSVQSLLIVISPYHVVNSYGLFTVMTVNRPEIIVEGSNDMVNWKEYEFKYKPGDTSGSLPIVEPHQPRLDWQMWFAALGGYRRNQWFLNFMDRILEGSPSVLKLLKSNPFPEKPPKYLRASVYKYTFTDSRTRKSTGDIWEREYVGLYIPILPLN